MLRLRNISKTPHSSFKNSNTSNTHLIKGPSRLFHVYQKSRGISSLARTPVIQDHLHSSQQRWIFGSTTEESSIHTSEELRMPHLMSSITPKATLDLITGHRLEICQGDITKERTQAIINLANEHLLHLNGVAHDIAKAGGIKLRDESDAWVQQNGPLSCGDVAVTSSGAMGPHPMEFVLHTVSPIWKGGNQDEETMMYNTVRNCLQKASELQIRSIAIPCLSDGLCRFPKDTCANIFFQSFADFCRSQAEEPEKYPHLVRITNKDDISTRVYVRMLNESRVFEDMRYEN
eukprot:gb/GECH01011826.1/.p1 GENE.gb/GECH01011826.1/~~gb/GECH01011826.1/.p1  ORF type:complete len:290 (+),score=72.09 gb/GECH01011826.1/:1-870(+)